VHGSWFEVRDLSQGDTLKSFVTGSELIVVDSLIGRKGTFKVYNFTVEDYHTYYVGQQDAVLVHNCGGVKKMKSLVKGDSRLLDLARKTFKGNDKLRKEANSVMAQLRKGDMNPGIGSKHIGKGIHEARTRGGARVYFKNASERTVNIVGYSNKSTQPAVISRLFKIY